MAGGRSAGNEPDNNWRYRTADYCFINFFSYFSSNRRYCYRYQKGRIQSYFYLAEKFALSLYCNNIYRPLSGSKTGLSLFNLGFPDYISVAGLCSGWIGSNPAILKKLNWIKTVR